MAGGKRTVSTARMVRTVVIVAAAAVMLGFIAKAGMDMVNRKMGLESTSVTETGEIIEETEQVDVPEMPSYDPVDMGEMVSPAWNPDWKATPCSLYITGGGEAVFDSLPQAPVPSERATELQLLMELWGTHAGYAQTEIDQIWAFSSGDTCFIDLPVAPDWQGVKETIEARFISYTIMFPFNGGEQTSGSEDGIPLRGIPSH